MLGFFTALIPGPDILFVLRNTLTLGFKQGIIGFLGIFNGWLIFLSLIYLGFASYFNSDSIQAILSGIGGIYLLYLAYTLFKKIKITSIFPKNPKRNFHFILKVC